jgi:hypothetical protein
VEAVSAGGVTIDQMLILPGKVHLERFYRDIDRDVLIGLSESGYTNDELSYGYIHHSERQIKKHQYGAYRILLCDGYKSHLTREILEFCEDKQIHILQPLNVVLFQPYKHFHVKTVDQATRTGCINFDKLEFLAAINGIQ